MRIPPFPENTLEVPPDVLSYHPGWMPSQAPFLLPRGDRIWYKYMFPGGMAEWLKAAVLKTAGRRRPAGSNPAPSATLFRTRLVTEERGPCATEGALRSRWDSGFVLQPSGEVGQRIS